jgi:hydrogenase nickel incorporation protein HypA/HybF
MHEISLVRSLIRQVESLVCDQGVTVTEIDVSIGPLSGVEPLLVQSAFSQLAPTSRFPEATLCIRETELIATCQDCGCSFSIASFRFVCPDCDSRAVDVTSGDGFRLERISVTDDCAPGNTTLTQATNR